MYRLPHTHYVNHHQSCCKFIKAIRLSVTYTPGIDQGRSDYEKKNAQANKTASNNADDDKKHKAEPGGDKKGDGNGYWTAENIKLYKERIIFQKKARAEAETISTIMGAGGAAAVTIEENNAAIQKNLDAQTKTPAAGAPGIKEK